MVKYSKKQIAALDKYYPHPNNLVTFRREREEMGSRPAIGTKNVASKTYDWSPTTTGRRINNLRTPSRR